MKQLKKRKGQKSETMKRDFVFAMAKGFRGKAKNCFRIANSQVEEALEHNVRRLSYWFH